MNPVEVLTEDHIEQLGQAMETQKKLLKDAQRAA